jgi:hypothetical protein
VALRVRLNPYVDLELTTEAARASEAADEQGRRDMANRLLADHIELAGAGDAGIAVGPVRIKTDGITGMTLGPGGEVFGRLRDELEELTGKPVLLNVLADRDPPRQSWWNAGAGQTLG